VARADRRRGGRRPRRRWARWGWGASRARCRSGEGARRPLWPPHTTTPSPTCGGGHDRPVGRRAAPIAGRGCPPARACDHTSATARRLARKRKKTQRRTVHRKANDRGQVVLLKGSKGVQRTNPWMSRGGPPCLACSAARARVRAADPASTGRARASLPRRTPWTPPPRRSGARHRGAAAVAPLAARPPVAPRVRIDHPPRGSRRRVLCRERARRPVY